jgi:hypothetical protein
VAQNHGKVTNREEEHAGNKKCDPKRIKCKDMKRESTKSDDLKDINGPHR